MWYPIWNTNNEFFTDDAGNVIRINDGYFVQEQNAEDRKGYFKFRLSSGKEIKHSRENLVKYHGHKPFAEYELIKPLYSSGKTIKEVAKIVGCSKTKVSDYVAKNNIKRLFKCKCVNCNKLFKTEYKRMFCSEECKIEHKRKTKRLTKKQFNDKKLRKKIISLYYRGFTQHQICKFVHKNSGFVSHAIYDYGCNKRGLCKECKKTFTKKAWSRSSFCSESCQKRYNKRNRKYLERSRYKKLKDIGKAFSIKELYSLQNGICHICGTKCDFDDKKVLDNGTVVCGNSYPSIDHIIPLSKGGKNTIDNISLAHRLCNSYKNALTDDEYESKKKEIAVRAIKKMKSERRSDGEARAC